MWTLECDSNILDSESEQQLSDLNLTSRARQENMATPGEEVSVRKNAGPVKGEEQYGNSSAIWLHLPMIGRRLHLVESFQLKDEKSVSRQHLTLTVSPVKPGDGVSSLHVQIIVMLL